MWELRYNDAKSTDSQHCYLGAAFVVFLHGDEIRVIYFFLIQGFGILTHEEIVLESVFQKSFFFLFLAQFN